MPKGQKAVIWRDEQDAKLLQAILAVHRFDINYKIVAKAFGHDVPGSCIATRIQKLRKKANELDLEARPTTASTINVAHAASGKSIARSTAAKTLSKKRKRGGMSSEDDDEDASMDSETSETDGNFNRSLLVPKTPTRQMGISGQVVKTRVSPRNTTKKNYAQIEDPFVANGIKDGDGNDVFEKSASENEEEASDEEYGKVMDAIKDEEGVLEGIAV